MRPPLVGVGERAQADAGTIGVGAAAKAGAKIGQTLGNRAFIQVAGPEIHQAASVARGRTFRPGRARHRLRKSTCTSIIGRARVSTK